MIKLSPYCVKCGRDLRMNIVGHKTCDGCGEPIPSISFGEFSRLMYSDKNNITDSTIIEAYHRGESFRYRNIPFIVKSVDQKSPYEWD